MLRTMREKTKIIMIILAVAFVGWLVFDVGMGVTGRSQGGTSMQLGSVNGTPIRYQEWLQTYQQLSDQQRQQNPGQTLTLEDQKSLEDQAFEQLVEAVIMRDEYQRRGITLTDQEIRDAARRYPPQEVTQAKDFQTDGKFDPSKWQRFLASGADPAFLAALEAKYRTELPRLKLLEDVTGDIFVSDAKLWQIYRDAHDSVTLRALVVNPQTTVADASVQVTEADLERYYRAHQQDFKMPARAYVSYVAIVKLPTSVDSAAAMARARALKDSLDRGVSVAALAKAESADSASADSGGQLPAFGHGQVAPAFERAAFTAPVGRVTGPVVTPFGIHLILVERRTKDSVWARHILIPIERTGARLDALESQADSLDRLAADQTDPTTLDSTAKWMGLGIQRNKEIIQGDPVVLGRYRIPDVGVWAFQAKPGETSQTIETSGAFYVFRLDSVLPAGVPKLADVTLPVRQTVVIEKKRAAAQQIAQDAARRLASGQTLDQVGAALHLPVQSIGPFARTGTVPVLGTATEAVGTAFRLRVGERSGMLSSDQGFFFIEPVRRVRADSAAWLKQKDDQRLTIIRAARQLRVQNFLQALREEAHVVDNRAQVLKPQAAEGTQ